MPDPGASQGARQMLERQLEGLGSLYNAGVRSPNFREWRQATLTCIQRIWPADPAKSERFRRIPFSPPMGRPGEREVREYYERGCGEAASLLKDYIAEIARVGVAGPPAPPSHAMGAPPIPTAEEDGFLTLELPGSGAAPPPVAHAPQPAGHAPAGGGSPPASSQPRLKDLLGFSDGPDLADTPSGAQELEAALAAAEASVARTPIAQPPPPAAPAPVAPMPGLESQGFFAPPASATREVAAPVAVPPGHAPAPPGHAAMPPSHGHVPLGHAPVPPGHTPVPPGHAHAHPTAPPPRIVVTGPELGAPPPQAVVPTQAPVPAPAPAPVPPADAGLDSGDLERIAEELLRATSAIGSVPRRTGQDRRTAAREIRSPIAIAVAALALEVEALGVPEGSRARARAVLLDLSRALDGSNLQWTALREATSFVMEFPGLGRRVVPLLLPYFDRAA